MSVHAAKENHKRAISIPRPWTPSQDEEVKQLRKKLDEANEARRTKVRDWEKTWFNEPEVRGREAPHRNDQAELYRILNELKVRGGVKRKDGGRQSVGDVEKEREAWAAHVKKVSETRGAVPDNVWDNIKGRNQTETWLGCTPSDIELDKCVAKMKTRRAAGRDKFIAEFLKYGGPKLRKRVYEIVKKMWDLAAQAEEGREGDDWPADWKIGLIIPMWKNKGKKTDKNTWRGITLLSVGSKILARVVSMRLQRWDEPWMNEAQCGFRRGRGVDDLLQVSRKVLEEVNRCINDEVVMMCFFDIEKAYPRSAKTPCGS